MIQPTYCAHCRREFDRACFTVKMPEWRRLSTGERVLSATHDRGREACRKETDYPAGRELTVRGRMAADGNF